MKTPSLPESIFSKPRTQLTPKIPTKPWILANPSSIPIYATDSRIPRTKTIKSEPSFNPSRDREGQVRRINKGIEKKEAEKTRKMIWGTKARTWHPRRDDLSFFYFSFVAVGTREKGRFLLAFIFSVPLRMFQNRKRKSPSHVWTSARHSRASVLSGSTSTRTRRTIN